MEYPFVPLHLRVGSDIVSLLSTTMVFGSPLEVTLSELAMSASSLGMQARAKSSQAELDELREVDTA